ncbi:MAG: TCR/Tet family MFS transporter [Fimbriimonadaceae bacterium]|nr:TCR/Tet family MFS transporter [Chitinophagales bacterium]
MKDRKQASMLFIFITLLIDVIGFGIIIPVLPDLIRELNGGNYSDASRIGGWLLFAFAIMQFIFSPILGNLSDRFGRRPVLLFSLFGFGCDYLLMALAPDLLWLFIGRMLAGITGASFTTAGAYIADVSPPEKKAQNFGLIGAAFGMGFIIGPALGGLLGELGSRVPFYGSAIITFLNFIYGFFILPESLPKEQRRKFEWKRANPLGALLHLKKYPLAYGLIISLICIYIAAHSVQSNWNFFTMGTFGWSERQVGLSLALVGLLVGLVQGVLIRYTIPKFGQKKSLYYGLALYTIGLILFGIASEGWMMFVFLIPYCLGGIGMPALQAIISSQVPANEQGELQGSLTSLMSATSIIGPVLMTNTYAAFTAENAPVHFAGAAFLLGAVFMFVSILFAMRSLKHYQPVEHEKQFVPDEKKPAIDLVE